MKSKIRYRFKKKSVLVFIRLIDFIGGLVFKKKQIDTVPNRILVVRLDHIGDVILTIPAICQLRRAYPNAYIVLLANEWVCHLFYDNNIVNEIIKFDAPWFRRGSVSVFSYIKVFNIIKKIKNMRFDVAFDFRGDIRNILVAYLSRVPRIIGYNIGGGGFLLTDVIEYKKETHNVDKNIKVIKPVVNNAVFNEFNIKINEKYIKIVDDFIRKNKIQAPIIGIHPGSGASSKLWSNKKWIELIGRIIEKYNFNVIITGSKEEKNMVYDIKNKFKSNVYVKIIDVGELLAFVKMYKVLITVDSAPLHIASAFNIPVVALFSATNDVNEWKPLSKIYEVIQRGVECKGCELSRCNKQIHKCMEDITVNEVFESFKRVLCRI